MARSKSWSTDETRRTPHCSNSASVPTSNPASAPVWELTARAPAVRVLSANLLARNTAHGEVLNLVRETKPDILLFLEVNSNWMDALEPLKAEYPHGKARPREDNFGIALLSNLDDAGGYDAVVGAVQHREFEYFAADDLLRLAAADAVIADIKGMWRNLALPPGLRRWQL